MVALGEPKEFIKMLPNVMMNTTRPRIPKPIPATRMKIENSRFPSPKKDAPNQ